MRYLLLLGILSGGLLNGCESTPRKARVNPCAGIHSEMAYQQCVGNLIAEDQLMLNQMQAVIDAQRSMYNRQAEINERGY